MHPFLYFGSRPSDWFEGANLGFDDGESRIWMQYTAPNAGATAIDVRFCCVSDAEDPDLVALCERAIDALHATLPNLGYGVHWSLRD